MLSQGELAAALHVHRTTVIAWEHGDSKPRPSMQRKLVIALHCTPDELLAALEAMKGDESRKAEPDNLRAA
jgi:DNA-binding transcriptional regulator YiaG